MSSPVSKKSSDHYAWGPGCDGWHLVRTPDLSVIEERMPPGTSEVRHRHERSHQFFYVLGGTLQMEIDGFTLALTAGTGCEVQPGAAHQASNSGASDAAFLVVSTPPSHGDRIPAPLP